MYYQIDFCRDHERVQYKINMFYSWDLLSETIISVYLKQ